MNTIQAQTIENNITKQKKRLKIITANTFETLEIKVNKFLKNITYIDSKFKKSGDKHFAYIIYEI